MQRMGNKRRRFVTASLGSLILMTLVLVACGGSPASTSVGSPTPNSPTSISAPTSTPTRQATASSFVGSYATTITQADIPPDSLALPGHWMITFEKDGLYAVFLEGAPHSVGTYQEAKQNQVTIMNDLTCIDFGQSEGTPGISTGTGTYTWTLSGKILTLKAVSDPCSPRKLVFSTHPWVKQG